MKILYGIQGTGHGHISRARELLPELSKKASVDVILSGYNSSLDPGYSIRFRKPGISLSYDSEGGVSVIDTFRNIHPIQFINDVRSIPLDEYDLIISDYEPISAWSASRGDVPCVALSHQASFLSSHAPRPTQKSLFAEAALQYFAPAKYKIGFHFERYDKFIEPPIIRSEIKELKTNNKHHIIVYLPAYHHEVIRNIFAPFTQVDWHIFSPFCSREIQNKNIWIRPVGHQEFLESFASSQGVICNAGFEMCAESMYLQKKLLAIPIRNQYEQQCNAEALKQLGVLILERLEEHRREVGDWLERGKIIGLDEVADPAKVLQRVLELARTAEVETVKPNMLTTIRTS